jgi:hypothetical protein
MTSLTPGLFAFSSSNLSTFQLAIYREDNGPFKSLDDLVKVGGVGRKKLSAIRDQICIENQATSAVLMLIFEFWSTILNCNCIFCFAISIIDEKKQLYY